MSTVHEMFTSGDEQEIQANLREVDELRRARGLQQLGPWWQIQHHGLFSYSPVQPRSSAATVPRRADGEQSVATTRVGPRAELHRRTRRVRSGRVAAKWVSSFCVEVVGDPRDRLLMSRMCRLSPAAIEDGARSRFTSPPRLNVPMQNAPVATERAHENVCCTARTPLVVPYSPVVLHRVLTPNGSGRVVADADVPEHRGDDDVGHRRLRAGRGCSRSRAHGPCRMPTLSLRTTGRAGAL